MAALWTAEEKAHQASMQTYIDAACDAWEYPYRAWDYGQHVEWGWGFWLADIIPDHHVNAADYEPDWATFHACPDEETARARATALNLGTAGPDDWEDS